MLQCVLGTSNWEMNFQYTAAIQPFVGRPQTALGSPPRGAPPPDTTELGQVKLHFNLPDLTLL